MRLSVTTGAGRARALGPDDGIRHVTGEGDPVFDGRGHGTGPGRSVEMRSGTRKAPWRRWATGVVAAMIVSAGPAAADCSLLLPSCWTVRVDSTCAAAPTRACVLDMRLRLLDRLMSADPEEARDLYFSESFDMAITSPELGERRRVAALAARHGFQPNRFGEAVKLFAEDRADWRTPLARGDVAGAIAAIPDPALSVSYQWLDGVADAIFREALRRGRAGEVLDAIAAGRITGFNWRSSRDNLFDRWFRLVRRGDPVLVERLIGLATPDRARSMRLALAATAEDPGATAAVLARDFPAPPTAEADRSEVTRAVWRAYDFLRDESAAVRERLLDALPRFVEVDSSGPTLDDPVGRGEVGIVRRLVARSLPDDDASGIYLFAPGMRSETIARSLPELDPPDRQAATGLMIEAAIAEGHWDRAVKLLNSPDGLAGLTGERANSMRARSLAEAAIVAGRGKAVEKLLASFDPDTRAAVVEAVGNRAAAEKLLALLDEDPVRLTQGAAFDEVEDGILEAAWDLAQTRGDCRGMLTAARNRTAARTQIDFARDLGRVASCLAVREEKAR